MFFPLWTKSAFCKMCFGNNRSTKTALLQGANSHIHFHNHMGFSWFPLLGSPVNFDESSAAAQTAANYWDRQKKGRLAAGSISASSTCEHDPATETANRHWRSSYEPSSAIRPFAQNPPRRRGFPTSRPSKVLSPSYSWIWISKARPLGYYNI